VLESGEIGLIGKAAQVTKQKDARKKPSRTVGRPRSADMPVSGDPRADIIAAAARLFRAKGIAGASVREIAEEAGLRKASLYYYFPSKEEIVYAMIEGVLAPALGMQKELARKPLSEAAKLYLYLRFDVEMLCSAPYDCTWLLAHGDLSDERMAAHWKEREKLLVWLRARLREGHAKGEFVACDAAAVAKAMLAATEYSVTWAERADISRLKRNAEEVAALLVRGVLAPGVSLDKVRAEASA
jgi:AcrR family transcriptional regulator|tara:strand:- start:1998 stop:2723 length:726 start_codon:yes stop_codon:yes gene_type:complete